VIGRVITVIVITLAGWLAAVSVAPLLGWQTPYLVSVSAMVLCLVPAIVTLVLAERARRWPQHVQVAVLLGGTGIRMLVVAVAAIVLSRAVAALALETGFIGWVIGFYLVTLAVEAYIVARCYSAPAGSSAGR
jgi:hypothetical protein